MRFSAAATVLALLTAPMVHAKPLAIPQPANAMLVSDPALLADLQAQHNETQAAILAGEVDYLSLGPDHEGGLEKRNALGGLIVRALLKSVSKRVQKNIKKAFNFETDEIWYSKDQCRIEFKTQGGGNERIYTWIRGEDQDDDASGSHEINSGWNDPENTPPPVHFYYQRGIGFYSVQFTATKDVAFGGIPHTKKCGFEGLCNAQLTFYRPGHTIVINEWDSQGSSSQCYYSDGEDCGGLCSSGVKDQFASGGMKWGGNCAVPCEYDGY